MSINELGIFRWNRHLYYTVIVFIIVSYCRGNQGNLTLTLTQGRNNSTAHMYFPISYVSETVNFRLFTQAFLPPKEHNQDHSQPDTNAFCFKYILNSIIGRLFACIVPLFQEGRKEGKTLN